MYEDWVTLQEVSQKTGISERTLRRRVMDGTLETANRPIPGRKPLVVVSPESAAKLEAMALKPVPVSNGTVPANVHMPSLDTMSLLTELRKPTLGLDKKVFLSLKESCEFSGLPKQYLLKRIKKGTLPAIKVGGWRIKRTTLEQLDVTG